MSFNRKKLKLSTRFRGLLPIVIDVETSGLDPLANALLEIAVVPIGMNAEGRLYKHPCFAYHIEPFAGAEMNPEALAVTKIDPGHPFRFAIPEQQALHLIALKVKQLLIETGCQRAVLVGHNAWFDLAFIQAALKRCKMHPYPFHSFTTLDTASLSALALGETVLAKAVRAAGIAFDVTQAHSAIYDAEKTADLFCHIVNRSL